MTNAAITKVESALGFALPNDYRDFLSNNADEVLRIKELLPLRAVLWTDAEEIIRENIAMRKHAKEMTVGRQGRRWPETYIVVGTNGADYWFIHQDRSKRGLWFWDHEARAIHRANASLTEYLKALRKDAKDPAKWQPAPVVSSFDPSCPLLDRFRIFISARTCEIQCQEADAPLTAAKFRRHGVRLKDVADRVLRIVAILANCPRKALTINRIPARSSSETLSFNFTEPPIANQRFRWVKANIRSGEINVYLALNGRTDPAPPPGKAGIDWSAFRDALISLLEAIYPPGTRVKVSSPKRRSFTIFRDEWNYDLSYSLS
jgi:hypothetical protein